MHEDRQCPFCSAAENRIVICAQPCNNASMIWHKGNEAFRCEFYKDSINAFEFYKDPLNSFDNLKDLWPFARILKGKGSSKQGARIVAKAPVEVSSPAIR